MKKLLNERLREWALVDDPLEKASAENDRDDFSAEGIAGLFSDFANEIERYYIPRPRFEDGEPLKNGDKIDYEGEAVTVIDYLISSRTWTNVYGMTFQWVTLHLNDGRSVNVLLEDKLKRPTPKVYDADGVEIKVGDTVYSVHNGNPMTVEKVRKNDKQLCGKDIVCCCGGIFFPATNFTHERPVFDAEGVRICKGDTVWSVEVPTVKGTVTDIEFKVGNIVNIVIAGSICEKYNFPPEKLTHREPDSLEKLRDFASEWSHSDNLSNSAAGDFRDAMQEVTDRLTALIERGA